MKSKKPITTPKHLSDNPLNKKPFETIPYRFSESGNIREPLYSMSKDFHGYSMSFPGRKNSGGLSDDDYDESDSDCHNETDEEHPDLSSDDERTTEDNDETEVIITEENYEEIVDRLKQMVLNQIISQHQNEQTKLRKRFIECCSIINKEKDDIIHDMELFGLGSLDKDKINDTLSCLENTINDLQRNFEDKKYISTIN
ncbi:hypothetical protein EHI8A_057420 [Entamoeba histolytica HM-1:IMSS-B]|uniref:Uncharacterized protein n=6 Tax=Entamoeba histolytica TaxID=5759 RepID=C4LZT4_ENTH1|nr:hypothetical protein EHI_194190 [Entamoeba histolytica HM-1:IMSS]EMD48201.1 Hypothetical protein EHI5A_089290 [Entamoeba histolytica KU27]EMH72484.1 hypothetical protein EHI8A_057420 [Entamoeba histolytica HM-1:IMSS-B]EMS13671.1 hypothetical protein KM1_110730 [Entamoeba histolytica HM-3:IMSS]ENY65473.1 hypothetical protein EHI7A_055570 [Entamoeba histolytica HM-1:IMSS-A]GAT94392.1 hypothetical protein CL6EHI_194190 [Entamoeba histolytica]|eukprot:XP_654718.1 hypothetical protein EHI_194190 [Entamoeba histolytica HM-1:IMSS]